MMTAGSVEPMFTRPLPVMFLLVALGLLIWPLWQDWKRARATSGVDDTLE
jgi:TctA family transporter